MVGSGYTVGCSMVPGSRYNTTNAFARAFPPPEYLTMPAVGIDISDYAVKHIMLGRRWPHFYLQSHGKLDIPLGVVERGEVKDMPSLVKILERLREEKKYEYAHMSLPEEHAFLFQMELPKGTVAEMDQMVEFQLKDHIPFEAGEAVFDYSVLEERAHAYFVNVSAYPRAIAQTYISALEESGFTLLSVEIEGQATARALLSHTHLEPTIIVDVGRNQASVSMSVKGNVTFTASIDIGGDNFTRAIARGLDVSFQEADRLKRLHGFRDTKDTSALFTTMYPVMAQLKETIHKHFLYWHRHSGVEGAHVARVVLVGGNANMAGLAEYLEATLEVPVVVGNVWTNVFSFNEYLPEMHRNESLEFATAVGLALRSLLRSG